MQHPVSADETFAFDVERDEELMKAFDNTYLGNTTTAGKSRT